MLVIIVTELEDVQINTSILDVLTGGNRDGTNTTASAAASSFLNFLNFNNATDPDSPFISEAQCLLGKDKHSDSLCIYIYIVIGVSLAVSFVLSMIQCITCNLCGLGRYLDLALAVAATLWWAVAGVVVTQGAAEANDAGLPKEEYRNAVVGLVWAEVAFFSLLTASGVVYCTGRCAGQRYEKMESSSTA